MVRRSRFFGGPFYALRNLPVKSAHACVVLTASVSSLLKTFPNLGLGPFFHILFTIDTTSALPLTHYSFLILFSIASPSAHSSTSILISATLVFCSIFPSTTQHSEPVLHGFNYSNYHISTNNDVSHVVAGTYDFFSTLWRYMAIQFSEPVLKHATGHAGDRHTGIWKGAQTQWKVFLGTWRQNDIKF